MTIKNLLLFFLCLYTVMPHRSLQGEDKIPHRQEMYGKTCIECHQELSPQIIEAWQASKHGLLPTGCSTCHGEEKNFNGRPTQETCLNCHKLTYIKEPRPPQSCMACHPRHGFTQHHLKN